MRHREGDAKGVLDLASSEIRVATRGQDRMEPKAREMLASARETR
jgi:hypothetical protein